MCFDQNKCWWKMIGLHFFAFYVIFSPDTGTPHILWPELAKNHFFSKNYFLNAQIKVLDWINPGASKI